MRSSSTPIVIDLFAGAGGLSLGAARAGFEVRLAVELDIEASHTHNQNFPNTRHLQKDISTLHGPELLLEAGLVPGELDGLIGGPPCQGFSVMGKGNVEDHRNDLFGHFMRLVAETRPKFFMAENVPGILNEKYASIRAEALSLVPSEYEMLDPVIVCADTFGVPTTRRRVFFVGFDPRRMKSLSVGAFSAEGAFEPTHVKDALVGLPEYVDEDWKKDPKKGWQVVTKTGTSDFMTRVTNSIPVGVGNRHALDRYLSRLETSGCIGTIHSLEVRLRYDALGYGQSDPISRATKLDPNGFCPTIRAGTGKEKGAFQAVRPIHFKEARVITPREAARLQGFPDWFLLPDSKWHSFRQIGNSVSPPVAEILLSRIISKL